MPAICSAGISRTASLDATQEVPQIKHTNTNAAIARPRVVNLVCKDKK
jgi:hypothetical protein